MTYREFLDTVIAANLSEEMNTFAASEKEKMNARNAKRRNTLSPEQEKNEVLKGQIAEYLGIHPKSLAADIAAEFGTSTQKVSALARQMVQAGTAKSEPVKIPKKGQVIAYSLADEAVAE